MARVNAMGKIEKRFTAQVSGTRLVASEAEGRVQAEPRDGKPTTMRPFRLLYAMALVVLQPLPCVAPADKRGRGYRRPQHDWPKKSTDFGGEAKGVASVWSSAGFRFQEVDRLRGPLRQDRVVILLRDELPKLRVAQWECSRIITGSGLGGSSLPQNLGSGQKECPNRNILGSGPGLPGSRER